MRIADSIVDWSEAIQQSNPQSQIRNPIRNPKSAIQSAIPNPQSNPQSQIRNPQ